jgi:hypothetical protein
MARPIDRRECLKLIKQKLAGHNPLVAFPDPKGFPNVVYLYDDDAPTMIDEVAQLMGYLSIQLKTPVVLFIEKTSKAPRTAYSCDVWLSKSI